MGFFSKLGNAAGDFASFAVPAGLTLGATALSGGAINPANAGGVMSLLGALGAGAKGFAGNEQEERARKMMLAQQKNQAMSNLINSLSPRANHQATQAAVPAPGFLEQGARGVGMGVDAIRMADMAKNAAEDRASRLAYEKAQTDRLNNLIKAQEGLSAKKALGGGGVGGSKGGISATTKAFDPSGTFDALRGAARYGIDPSTVGLQGGVVESMNTRDPYARQANFGDLAGFGITPDGRAQTAIAEGTQAAADARLADDATRSLIASRVPKAADLPDRTPAIEAVFSSLAKRNPDKSVEELMLMPEALSLLGDRALDGQEGALAQTAIANSQSDVQTALESAETQADVDFVDLLYGPIRTKVSGDKLLSNSAAMVFARESINAGFKQGNGAGDVLMASGTIKLGDPGLGVRPAEVLTLEEALPWLERMGLWTSGEKVIEGDRYSPEFRDRLMVAADDFYKSLQKQVQARIAAEIATVKSTSQFKGANDPSVLLNQFMGTYNMVDIPFLNRSQAEALREIDAQRRQNNASQRVQ